MIHLVSKYSNYVEELPQRMKDSPHKASYFIEKLGIPKATYYRKLKDKSFNVEEVRKITKILYPKEALSPEPKETLADKREQVHIGKQEQYEKLMDQVIKGVS